MVDVSMAHLVVADLSPDTQYAAGDQSYRIICWRRDNSWHQEAGLFSPGGEHLTCAQKAVAPFGALFLGVNELYCDANL